MIRWFTLVLLLFSSLVWADVEVVNAYSDMPNNIVSPDNATASTPTLSLDQRVGKLEQQIANQQQMNLPNQIQALQQDLQKLQGQVELQQHQLQQMQTAQKQMYLDLTSQIKAKANTINQTTNNAQASPNMPQNFLSDQDSYQNAYQLLINKKYDAAGKALQNYLTKFPQGQYSANAHYWLGEIYSMQKKSPLALREFQTVINQYPQSNKVPDALLKMGMINADSGKIVIAKQQLQTVINRYPNTTVAKLAEMRLQGMGK